ncbi:MAG: ribosome biogenesis GTPase Der [Rikenellaceae bacterium]|nr:ribosome biogenesis GTPase Der [Rikenellaceae bacterium]
MSIVEIVARPNVGKSTFFNRLVGKRKAIVNDMEATYSDRHYGTTDWNGREFSVIDTGGYVVNSDDIFEGEIRKQVALAIDEADLILFMVEVSTGITDVDMEIADILRRTTKKVITVVNKVDNSDQLYLTGEFFGFGLGEPISISSMTGSGTGDLMDKILEYLPEKEDSITDDNLPKITVVGRPNVGKSSLTNALLGDERNIVTPIAGTTRDSISTRYNKFGMDFYLVDTAGLRKKGKVTEDLEFYSVMRSIRAIENSDICILMLDATQGIESQDMNIFQLIVRNKKGCVVVVNKWDLVEKQNNTMRDYTELLKKKLAPFNDVPIIFTSVINKLRIYDVLQNAIRVYENRQRKLTTSVLNEYFLPIIEETPPPSIKGKYVKIKYVTQLASPTPAFVFFANLPQYIKDPYRRFLENKLRSQWDFQGVPILIYFRQK